MGIPHLITHLYPCSELEELAGQDVVIDGPGLAYHIFHACKLAAQPPIKNLFDAGPTYKELGDVAIVFLNSLQASGVLLKGIYFDGYLPLSKSHVRLGRLEKLSHQLQGFCGKKARPYQASLIYRSTAKCPTIPPPFLVPAILEALHGSDYEKITKVVPGEADEYCALHIKHYGRGIILTGDSDLLVHDLGLDGAVIFFKDLAISWENVNQYIAKGRVYRPTEICSKLALPSSFKLSSLAFEIFLDKDYTSFTKLLAQAKALKAVTSNEDEYERFSREYASVGKAPVFNNDGVVLNFGTETRDFQYLDPRISEYVMQYPILRSMAGCPSTIEVDSDAHVFLPFILDCPERTSSWEITTHVRLLAYGLTNFLAPESQHKTSVHEHRKRYNQYSGRKLSIPNMEDLLDTCKAISCTLDRFCTAFTSLDPIKLWVSIAIHQDLEWSLKSEKIFLSSIIMEELPFVPGPYADRQYYTWNIVQFLAQIQASYYSFRILKQITELVVKDCRGEALKCISNLKQSLSFLPKLRQQNGTRDISHIVGRCDLFEIYKISHKALGISENELYRQLVLNGDTTPKKAKGKPDNKNTDSFTESKQGDSSNFFDVLKTS